MLKFSIHPGRILREEFMAPMDLSAIALARHIDVPRTRIERLIREETAMTVDTAARLAAAFETSAAFWMNLQTAFDLRMTQPIKGIKPITVVA